MTVCPRPAYGNLSSFDVRIRYYRSGPKTAMVVVAGEFMTKIDMSFTKGELRLLIKLAYTGYYVCDRDGDSDAEKKTKELLIDRLLQIALSYKVMEGIDYESKYDRHFLDADREDSLLDDYNDFIEETFWDELVYRLGQRDLLNAVGEKELSKMELKERIAQEEEHMEKYRREFEENGIRRVKIAK
jgi:hypothetical protein